MRIQVLRVFRDELQAGMGESRVEPGTDTSHWGHVGIDGIGGTGAISCVSIHEAQTGLVIASALLVYVARFDKRKQQQQQQHTKQKKQNNPMRRN